MSKKPVKSCTVKLPIELLQNLRAVVDVLPYPHKESVTSILTSGLELRLKQIRKKLPEIEGPLEHRLSEMEKENTLQEKSNTSSS